MLPNFNIIRTKRPPVVIDFETTLIKQDGTVDKIWCIGWMWKDIQGNRKYMQMYWEDGISVVNLCSLMNNVHTRAKIHGREQDVKLSHLASIVKTHIAAFHNAGFDKRLLDAINVEVDCYHDTMLLTYCLFPPALLVNNVGDDDNHQLYSLKNLGLRGFCREKIDAPVTFDAFTESMLTYNKGDLDSTGDLLDAMLPMLEKDTDAYNSYISVALPSTEMAYLMTKRGVHIPDDKLDDLILECEDIVAKELATLHKYVPVLPSPNKPKEYAYLRPSIEAIPVTNDLGYEHLGKLMFIGEAYGVYKYREIIEFNPNSHTHKRYALKHLLDWESPRKTKSGNSSVDKHAMKQLYAEVSHPFVRSLMQHSMYDKLLKGFLVPWKTMRDEDLRIHPSFINTATATGRYASRNPNFQNIPSTIKQTITAGEGFDFVYVDLSQAELRILAYYMSVVLGDNQLWKLYAKGADVHDNNRQLMNLPAELRVIAKRAIFLKIYGGGAKVFSVSCDLPITKAKYYLKRFDEVLPGIDNLAKVVGEAIRSEPSGIIRTLMGRRIVYPHYKKYYVKGQDTYNAKVQRAFRQYFNALFQGSCFDIATVLGWEAMPKCIEAGGAPVLQVHDSYLFEIPEASSGIFADELNDIFNNNSILEGLPLVGIPGIGKTWEDAEKDAKRREDEVKKSIQTV